jgi:hypothetical protein
MHSQLRRVCPRCPLKTIALPSHLKRVHGLGKEAPHEANLDAPQVPVENEIYIPPRGLYFPEAEDRATKRPVHRDERDEAAAKRRKLQEEPPSPPKPEFSSQVGKSPSGAYTEEEIISTFPSGYIGPERSKRCEGAWEARPEAAQLVKALGRDLKCSFKASEGRPLPGTTAKSYLQNRRILELDPC